MAGATGRPRLAGGDGAKPKLAASVLHGVTVSASASLPVICFPFPCRIVAASLVSWNSAVAASDVDYWSVDLARNRANTRAVIATKTSKTTGGEAIAARTAWMIDPAIFDPVNAIFAKGDSAEFVLTKNGAAGNLIFLALTVQYEAI